MRNLLRRFFANQATSLTRAAWLIASAGAASRLLGLFRDRVLASEFGAGDALDIYYAAFRFPDFVYNLVIVGALSAGFIPVFLSAKHRGNNEHWRVADSFLSAVFFVLFVSCFLVIAFAPYVVHLLTPGFSPEKQGAVVVLTRIITLSPFLLGLSAVAGAVLQSTQRFFLFAVAPIFYNLGIITGALFLAPRFGVVGLAWGVVIGAAFHLGVQVIGALALGWRPKFSVPWRDPAVWEIGHLMWPRVIAAGTQQINIFALTIIASTLSAGSLAILNFATNLYFVPVALIGISYGVAAFPKLTQSAIAADATAFRDVLATAIRQVTFLLIPSAVLLFTLREHVVRITLGAGAFDWRSTQLTEATLGFMVVSVLFGALVPLLIRGFYAHRNVRIPLYVGLVSDAATIIAALFFSRTLGVIGLGIALSVGTIVQFIGLWVGLNRMVAIRPLGIGSAVFKQVAAGVGMVVATVACRSAFTLLYDTSYFVALASAALVSAFSGSLIYLILVWLFNEPTVQEFWVALRARYVSRPIVGSMEEGTS